MEGGAQMCGVCMGVRCHPRCPVAPEPEAVYKCRRCGGGICEGDKYLDSLEGKICEDCLDGMTVNEVLGLFGERLATA